MKALVVVESLFGNTRAIAEAVAEGLASASNAAGPIATTVRPVGEAPREIASDVDLLVVGAPTHQFGMSRPSSRAEAANKGAGSEGAGPGVREWLATLAAPSRGVAFATFTTQVDRPRWIRRMGSAARAADTRLGRMGCERVAAPESFFVDGVAGPLLPGEIDRARGWGAALGKAVAPPPAHRS